MKKILYTLLAFAITIIATSQAPQGFNYQATIRNSAGALVVNQNVLFKFNIMLNSQTSLPVYSETHQAPTDDLGQVNLTIGQGTATTGTFSAINWANGTYYLGIELNTGSGYVAMGTTQLLSVPYALYANSAGNSQATTPNLASVLAVNNGANNLQIKDVQNPTEAQDAVTKSYLDIQISQIQAQLTALQNSIIAPLPSVTIGTQIWSNTNLDVTTYRDGTPIPQVTNPNEWTNLTKGAWCYYNNNEASYGAIYGKLYNWYAVVGIYDAASLANPAIRKDLAPQGWHIPSDEDWNTLITFLGGESVAGGKMKSTGITQLGTGLWNDPNIDSTNSSLFTGLPGGYRVFGGSFYNFGNFGNWWSSSENTATSAWARQLEYDNAGAHKFSDSKADGFSVRCIKD